MDLDRPPLDELVAAVEAEGRSVELAGAVRRSGWENVVLETRDGWILRFPRDHVDFDRELAILHRLADRLPVPIPRVEWTGRKRRFAAYRKLVGCQFDETAYAEALPSERDALASSLAEFLAAMHSALSPSASAPPSKSAPVTRWIWPRRSWRPRTRRGLEGSSSP